MQVQNNIFLFPLGAKETQVVPSLEKCVYWPPQKPQLYQREWLESNS